jgi:hypothetical protein
MQRKFQWLLSTFVSLLILVFMSSTVILGKETKKLHSSVTVKAPCCDHNCQTSLIDEEDAEDAEDEEADDKDTSAIESDNAEEK